MQHAGGSTASEAWVLTYIIALLCGLLLALAVHIGLTAAGVGIAGAALDVIFQGKDQIKTALAWWAIGLAGCCGGLAAIALARRWNRPRWRWLRLIFVFLFICLLAFAGQKAGAPAGSGTAITAAANLAAMMLGGFMAFFAAHFAARR